MTSSTVRMIGARMTEAGGFGPPKARGAVLDLPRSQGARERTSASAMRLARPSMSFTRRNARCSPSGTDASEGDEGFDRKFAMAFLALPRAYEMIRTDPFVTVPTSELSCASLALRKDSDLSFRKGPTCERMRICRNS
jgi:hypothetical protein